MNEVYLIKPSPYGRQGYSFDHFSTNFVEICRSHRAEGRALVFCFILYDFTNAEVGLFLDNSRYWDALNAISGPYLTVFTFHYSKTRSENASAERRAKALLADLAARNSVKSQISSYNSRISARSPDDVVRLYEAIFTKSAAPHLPALIFFQVNEDTVSEPFNVKIRGSTQEEAFNDVRSIIRDATNSVSQVLPENRGNTKEIFDLVKVALEQRELFFFLKKSLPLVQWISGLIGGK
jgi:hypothetical protein